MLIGLLLWLAVVIFDFLVYLTTTPHSVSHLKARRLYFGVVAVLIVVSRIILLKSDWRLWLLTSLFLPYILINLARAARLRLHVDQLRTSSLASLSWLVTGELTALGLSWVFLTYNLIPYVPIIIISLQTVVNTYLLISTIRLWRSTHPEIHPTPLTDSKLPSLSVLIPARNETATLRVCLENLVASDYPRLEIIVLDDNSSDRRTPEIIRSFAQQGVRFVQGKRREKYWLAKNSAYEQLRLEASGELLMFCGVDVIVEPSSLRRLVEVLLSTEKDMISILPMRPICEKRKISFIQVMRYWWELCLPRELFKRPPVLSTLWLMRSSTMQKLGGLKAAAKTIVPEAYFAKATDKTSRYLFLRSNPKLPIYSYKGTKEQFATMVRVRYPQLHRRLSLVAFTALFDLVFLVGPYVALVTSLLLHFSWWVILLSAISVASLSAMYYLVGIRTRLNNLVLGLLTAPIAFLLDIFMVHYSMLRYEFGTVTWHDRGVNESLLEVIPKLPDNDDTGPACFHGMFS